MLEDGLSYPLRDEWFGRILIGGILSYLSFLVIPVILINGYVLRVLKDTVDGKETPPEFTDWEWLFVKGVGSFVIVLAYAIIPVVLYGFIITTFVGVGSTVGGDARSFLAGFGIISTLLAIPVILFVYYLIPAALTNYASEGSIGAGFALGTITNVVFSVEYLVAVLLPIVVAVILWVVTFVLAITIIGILFIPFVQFYGQVAIFRMFGTAFHEVRGSG